MQKDANIVELEKCCRTHILILFSCKISFWYSRERARQKFAKFSKNAFSKNAPRFSRPEGYATIKAMQIAESDPAVEYLWIIDQDAYTGLERGNTSNGFQTFSNTLFVFSSATGNISAKCWHIWPSSALHFIFTFSIKFVKLIKTFQNYQTYEKPADENHSRCSQNLAQINQIW